MLTIEKVFLLKSIEMFQSTPENNLIAVAEILEEVFVEAGQTLFRKGDNADSMYIIHSGEMRIHDGDHVFAVMKGKEFFGELSLLDAETRSATASANKDTFLFKINQGPFYELMSNNQEVTRSIIKTLCTRLRQQNKINFELKTQLKQVGQA
ncbi:MAG: cyclic nucleotide-binding domain-containing protein [Bacteroidetes bacterium]|nr:cyclic nucleotide-binding domain-containing protein [Bacteroidota bacterium]MBP7477572.1 cyclic nucleotide-binding domain-containing protein [Chitinophagales bacterium]